MCRLTVVRAMPIDRRWMIVDAAGQFQSQRDLRAMAQLAVTATGTGIEISHAETVRIAVDFPPLDAPLADVVVWCDRLHARVAVAAGPWLSTVLGKEVRLVFMHDTTARPVETAFRRDAEVVSFADAFPILVTSTTSLADALISCNLLMPAGTVWPYSSTLPGT